MFRVEDDGKNKNNPRYTVVLKHQLPKTFCAHGQQVKHISCCCGGSYQWKIKNSEQNVFPPK